jgi:thioredoxin 1
MRVLVAFSLVLLFGISPRVPACAAEAVPFERTAFAAAQAAGKPILIDVYAYWCPTCARQKPILSKLEKSPEFIDLVVFTVDFDWQRDVARELGAQLQSTLIVFRGPVEKGRSVGDTDETSIAALLRKATS